MVLTPPRPRGRPKKEKATELKNKKVKDKNAKDKLKGKKVKDKSAKKDSKKKKMILDLEPEALLNSIMEQAVIMEVC